MSDLNKTFQEPSNPLPPRERKASWMQDLLGGHSRRQTVVDFKKDNFSRFVKISHSRLTKKVDMSVAVNVISLSEIDTVNQCFTCEVRRTLPCRSSLR